MVKPRFPGNEEPTAASPSDWTKSAGAGPTAPRAEPRFTPGTMLAGRYRVVSRLGWGGMGEVYRADDTKLGQAVALKFLRGELTAEARRRLYAEVRVGRQVSHPNVCRIYDVVEVEGHTFLAMEYVDGEDLASLLKQIGHLPPDKALEVARDLCAGLAAAHDRGVVHRDLKPGNVMIDGRGRARLTDFGLALEQTAPASGSGAGTPLYMSPEQLATGTASEKSDLYSLGLLLYEMISGRRFYEVTTLQELRNQHLVSKQPLLEKLAERSDRALERVIHQCLEEEPRERPASARAVLALLPGGDPIDAALAAGETPAPEVVAAAGEVGELQPAAAWAALLGLLATLAFAVYAIDRTAPVPKTAKAPEVLVERSRSVLKTLGHDAPAADWTFSYEWDLLQTLHFEFDDSTPRLWERLRDAPLPVLRFYYRQSPKWLVASNRDAVVERRDPPPDMPGMAEVVLTPQGHLTSFVAVPPQVEAGGPWPVPDWSLLFREANLDSATFRATASTWSAPVDSDYKAAWEGTYPGMADTPVRIEGAAYHGRPVWFAVLPPWAAPAPVVAEAADERAAMRSPMPFGRLFIVLLALALPIGGVVLARRNVRLGRGDRRGASRVAMFIFIAYVIARLSRAAHVSAIGSEVWLLIKVTAYPAFWAALMWVVYLALEPYARRLWPRVLISWGRLLAGKVRDPMVGRDVLLGSLAGALGVALMYSSYLIADSFDRPAMWSWTPGYASGLTGRNGVFRLFVNAYSGVLFSVAFVFLLVILRKVLRRNWLALAVWCFLISDSVIPMLRTGFEIQATSLALGTLLSLAVLLRCGLLGLACMSFVSQVVTEVPVTLDMTAWYASRGLLTLAPVVGLAVYAFWISLGGKSALGRAWLED